MLSNLCLEYCVVEQFSTVQQVLIVKTFYGNGECLMQAVQKFQTILGRNEAPCKSTVHTLLTQLKITAVPLFGKNISAQVISTLKLNKLFQTLVFFLFFIFTFIFILLTYRKVAEVLLNKLGKELPWPASEDAKILLSACNLIEI